MTRCPSWSLGGKQCELEKGHDGKHSVAWSDGGTFTWSDKSQADLYKRYGGRS